jgi:prefoldin subunit 4
MSKHSDPSATGGPKHIDLCWQDQQDICTFARINTYMKELQEKVRVSEEELANVKDALDEICIADDVRFLHGESFVQYDNDAAETLLNQKKASIERNLGEMKQKLAVCTEKMNTLRGKLYATIGKDNIYLEDE